MLGRAVRPALEVPAAKLDCGDLSPLFQRYGKTRNLRFFQDVDRVKALLGNWGPSGNPLLESGVKPPHSKKRQATEAAGILQMNVRVSDIDSFIFSEYVSFYAF